MNHRYLAGAVLCGLITGACHGTAVGTGIEIDPGGPSVDEPGPPALPKGPAPSFGATVNQADAPPPLSGGTMILTQDGARLVAADPDRDQVYIVTLADNSVVTVPLQAHDEPGRVVDDASGHAHVVLRGGGAVATIDIATGTVLGRRTTCPAPRGIALDASSPRLIVACEGGQVMQMATAADAAPTVFAQLDRDLRDVLVIGSSIFVSHFRSGSTFVLDSTGSVVTSDYLPSSQVAFAMPHLAWRMLAPKTGSKPIIVHQASTMQIVSTQPGGYDTGGSFPTGDGTVDVTSVNPNGVVSSYVNDGENSYLLPSHAVLPVDIATDGKTFAVVAAGNGHTKELPQIFTMAVDGSSIGWVPVKGQATSVVILPSLVSGALNLAVLSREPAQIEIGDTIIPLSNVSREDTGHAIFHSNSGSGIACASCHAEGRDDGHVWSFDTVGARRTPSMLGTLSGTAPYHWDGDQFDIPVLVDNVMTGRMNGPQIADDQKGALQSWLFALPGPVAPTPVDTTAVDRGKTLFTSPEVGCSTCHSGAHFTSSLTVDVGTGGAFQIPSLIGVGARAPYLHDGRAATLSDRFTPVGGGDMHGKTSGLTAAQISDLVAYLDSL